MIKLPFIKRNRTSVFEQIDINWSLVAESMSKWPDGTQGWLNLSKKGRTKSLEQLGYYYAVILPTAVQAFSDNGDFSLTLNFKDKAVEVELTKANVDMFLKLRYSERLGVYKDKADMSMGECAAYEDWCIQWLAQWLNCHIPPADTNWRKDNPELRKE